MGFISNALNFSILFLCFLNISAASEIDSFTQRFEPLQDAIPALNQVVNEKILVTLQQVNRIKGCSINRLYQAFQDDFTGPLLGPVEQAINKHNIVDSLSINRPDSIYADIGMLSGSALYFYGLGSIVNLGGHIVGADKFGHFFSEGHTYFKKSILEEQDLIDVLRFGESSERGFFGWTMTGVFSYADLAVNFSGLKFWVNLYHENPRVKERNYGLRNPKLNLLDCQNGQWVLVRPFKWEDYIDSSWDEAINCNLFPEDQMENNVALRIAKVMKGRPYNPYCPIDSKKCRDIVNKYGPMSRYIIHPRCLQEAMKSS